MSIWTVRPLDITTHLNYIDDGGQTHPFWIKLKKHLNVGEKRKQQTAGWGGVKGQPGGGAAEVSVNWSTQSFSRTEAYLIDWSLADGDVKVPCTREGIESLDEAVYKLIEDAITAHVEAMEQEKKARTGRSEPPTTSD